MKKWEHDKCDELRREAIEKISTAKTNWIKYERCLKIGDVTNAEVALREYEHIKGCVEGINQVFVSIGYIAGDMKELSELKEEKISKKNDSWILVNKRLPQFYEPVLCLLGDDCQVVAALDENGENWVLYDHNVVETVVIAWKPLEAIAVSKLLNEYE